MGDRVVVRVVLDQGGSVDVYGHWAGSGVGTAVVEAVKRARPRWGDEPYCARVIVQSLCEAWSDDAGEDRLGCGLGSDLLSAADLYGLVVIDVPRQLVEVMPVAWVQGEGAQLDDGGPVLSVSFSVLSLSAGAWSGWTTPARELQRAVEGAWRTDCYGAARS